MSPIRVLVDCRVVSERIDGLSRYTIGLVRAMLREPEGLHFQLLVPAGLSERHPLREVMRLESADVVESDVAMMSPAAHVRMTSLFRRLTFDVYHYPHFNLPLSAPAPRVITLHDITPLTYPDYFGGWRGFKRAYFGWSVATSVRRAAAVVVPSAASAEALVAVVPHAQGRTEIVHEGIDEVFVRAPKAAERAEFRARHRLAGPYLLYVGVHRPHKNLVTLIRAYAAIAPRVTQELVLVGQAAGETTDLARIAQDLGVAHRVHRLGYLTEDDLAIAYREADALVLCSLVEGFGLPILEAMSCGTAVVASDRGAAAEVADNAARLVDPLSVDSIAAGLREVCSDEGLRSELRRRGSLRAREFSWAAAAQRTVEVYRRVARKT